MIFFLIQLIFSYQLIILHGIQKLVECIGCDLVLFVGLDVVKLRIACCILGVTVQINFSVLVLTIFIQRKKCNIFFVAGIKDSNDGTFYGAVVVKGQCYGYAVTAAGRAVAVAFLYKGQYVL